MLTIAIDCGDQLRNGHAALAGDLLQTVPELLFKAHVRLVAALTNRALRNRRLHSFSPPQRRNRKRSFLNRCANNFNLWPEQHSQQQATQGNFWQPQRGSGENRCGSRGPLELSLRLTNSRGSHKPLIHSELRNRSGASAVYLAVDCRLRCPRAMQRRLREISRRSERECK